MQMELTMDATDMPIQILSVNQAGLDVSAGNLGNRGYSVPMLQDTLSVNAWGRWKANLRDFFILDSEGRLISITQLSPRDEGGGGIVGDKEAYTSLKSALRDVAMVSP